MLGSLTALSHTFLCSHIIQRSGTPALAFVKFFIKTVGFGNIRYHILTYIISAFIESINRFLYEDLSVALMMTVGVSFRFIPEAVSVVIL